MASNKESGKVKFFNADKGFGFIKCEDQSELFFHITKCAEGYKPRQEDKVEYYVGDGKRGAVAEEVTLVSE